MCKVMENYINEAVSEAVKETKKETTLDLLVSMIKDGIITISEAAKRAQLPEEEFRMRLNK